MKLIRRIVARLGVGTALILGGSTLLFGLHGTGWKAMNVQTGSMSPNIPKGSMVFVHSVPTSSLKVGDVITYASMQKRGKTISHRITQTYLADGKIPGFVTKGDANKVADAPIVGGQVKGKVMYSLPYLGKLLSLLRTWPGIIVLIYIPALFIFIDELRRLAAYYRQFMPYKVAQVLAREKALAKAGRGKYKIAAIPGIAAALLAASVLFALPVQALFKTNSVVLVNGNITVTSIVNPPPVTTCNGNSTNATVNTGGSGGSSNNNNVIVGTSTSQTATTGDATNTGNTNGGSATSGDATNCNSTNIDINITNH